MKKAVKVAAIMAAAVVVITVILFVAVPSTTSKQAETKLSEALAGAGIPKDMWSAEKVYYVPLLGHLVVENFKIGEQGGDTILQAKKVTLALDTRSEDLFAGSAEAQGLSFSADDAGISVKNLSVKNFSVDKALFKYSPFEAVKKLGNISLSGAVFRQKGRTYFSLGGLNADIGYVEGKLPLSSSLVLKDFVMDVRQFAPLPALRPEYRLANFEIRNSVSAGVYKINLVIDGTNLFAIKAALGISVPAEFLASGDISHLSAFDYEEDVKLDSFSLTYTDKSFLDHVFELAGISGGRAGAAEQFGDSLPIFALIDGGADAKRFHDAVAQFIAKPGMFELKTNIASPLSFDDISQNPLALNVSLSINGGKPFTTGKN